MAPELAESLAHASTLAADALVLLTLANLQQREPQPWLTAWLGSWACSAVVHGALWTVASVPELAWLQGVAFVSAVGATVLLVHGVGQFVEQRLLGPWLGLVALGTVGSLGLVALGYGFEVSSGPSAVALAAGYLWGGAGVLRTDLPGRWMAGVGMVAFGLHMLDAPWLLPVEALRPWGLALGGWIQLLIGFGVAIIHLDRARDVAASAEDELTAFLERAVVGVYRSTPDEGIVYANPALVGMLGYETADEVLALRVPEELYLDPAERGRVRMAGEGTVLAGFEATWRRKDGRPLIVALDGREVRDADGEVLYWEGFARDVTRGRMLEAELARSQRMEALGRLAGGVAHDFNNLLTVILGNLELVDRDRLGPDRTLFDAATTSVERAAEITGQLLSLGRPAGASEEVVDARKALLDTLSVLERTVGARIQLHHEVPDGPVWVPLSRAQLSQLVMNLVLNARDALPEGGSISATLRTGAVRADAEGRWVELAVVDDGEGMPAEVLEHIFEPFFTTRDEGQGTGLGLATVYMTVRDAGGSITAESRVGEGSTFRVLLRKAKAPEPSVPPLQKDFEAQGTIVVVDDRDDVREFVVRCLRQLGYEVRDHGDPAAAREDVAENPPDLLLTDVVMPEQSGPEMVAALHAQGVEVPVLFMSGYPRPGKGGEELQGPLLAKPFTLAALKKAVARALESHDRPPDSPGPEG